MSSGVSFNYDPLVHGSSPIRRKQRCSLGILTGRRKGPHRDLRVRSFWSVKKTQLERVKSETRPDGRPDLLRDNQTDANGCAKSDRAIVEDVNDEFVARE